MSRVLTPLVAAWREHRLRAGRLPQMRRLASLPRAREGVFRLGVRSGGGELAWDPWGSDSPHILVAGTTGSGKSRLMESMALSALGWGWQVEIIDAKGGGDYWAATAHGARVISDPKDTTAALKRAAKDIADRNALMLRTPVVRERGDGRLVEDRATTMRDLPLAVRQEHDLRPRLVLIDETASILDDKKDAMPALRRAVQLGRSAGVHIVLGMQRPDADLLPGFIKHQAQARILFGPADQEAERMVLGAAVAGLDDTERTAPRPAGRALASGVGGQPIARFHAFLVDRDTYLPFHPSDEPPGTAGDPGAAPAPAGLEDAGSSSSAPAPAPDPRRGSLPGSLASSSRRLLSPVARVRLRLGALRCLVGPRRDGPFVRDPDLAVSCKARDGHRCRVCGAGPPVQADHRRPLWAGGADAMSNLWTLCVRCHKAKTRVEATCRALRRRRGWRWWWPRLPVWQWAVGACFALGLVRHAYVLPAVLVLGVLAWWEWRHRGRGVDRISTFDARMEESTYRGSLLGAVAAGRMRTAWTLATLRWGLMVGAGAYLVGVWAASRLPLV